VIAIQDISEDIESRTKRAATEAFFTNLIKGTGTELSTLESHAEEHIEHKKLAESYNTIIGTCSCPQAYAIDYSPSRGISGTIIVEVSSLKDRLFIVPQKVESFLHQNNLILCFVEIRKMILSIFKNIKELEITIETDPEIENSNWVCFDITIEDEDEEVLKCYDSFTKKFIKKFSEGKRNFFRLAINLE